MQRTVCMTVANMTLFQQDRLEPRRGECCEEACSERHHSHLPVAHFDQLLHSDVRESQTRPVASQTLPAFGQRTVPLPQVLRTLLALAPSVTTIMVRCVRIRHWRGAHSCNWRHRLGQPRHDVRQIWHWHRVHDRRWSHRQSRQCKLHCDTQADCAQGWSCCHTH